MFSTASTSFVEWHCIFLVCIDSIQYNGSFRMAFYGPCQDLVVFCIVKLILNDKMHHRRYFTTIKVETVNVEKITMHCKW